LAVRENRSPLESVLGGPAKEIVDKRNWRRDCATRGRDEARRQMAKSACTPPRLTHQSDEKQRFDACELTLEEQIEELKAKMAELEAALEEKARATTAALKEDCEAECQRRTACRTVRMVTAAAPDDRDGAALRREQLASDRVEARQNHLIGAAGVGEGDRVRPYRPARNRKVTEASFGSTTWSTTPSDTLVRR
jgi:predicted RNase H-like nuclease (RuvC/YqgF family)